MENQENVQSDVNQTADTSVTESSNSQTSIEQTSLLNTEQPTEQINKSENEGEGASNQTNETAPVYEFKAPEGKTFDENVLNAFTEAVKAKGVAPDAAQEILDKVAPVLEKQQLERIEVVSKEWIAKTKADPEIGNSKLQETIKNANSALKQFGSNEFKGLLNESGLGNHPEVLRFLSKVGQSVAEDKFEGGSEAQQSQSLTRLYPYSNMK